MSKSVEERVKETCDLIKQIVPELDTTQIGGMILFDINQAVNEASKELVEALTKAKRHNDHAYLNCTQALGRIESSEVVIADALKAHKDKWGGGDNDQGE